MPISLADKILTRYESLIQQHGLELVWQDADQTSRNWKGFVQDPRTFRTIIIVQVVINSSSEFQAYYSKETPNLSREVSFGLLGEGFEKLDLHLKAFSEALPTLAKANPGKLPSQPSDWVFGVGEDREGYLYAVFTPIDHWVRHSSIIDRPVWSDLGQKVPSYFLKEVSPGMFQVDSSIRVDRQTVMRDLLAAGFHPDNRFSDYVRGRI